MEIPYLPEIILWTSILIIAGAYFRPTRGKFLGLRIAGVSLYSVYFFIEEAYSGAFASLIAAVASFSQAIVPEEYLKKTLYWRLAAAIFFASVGVYIFLGKESIWPMFGIVLARLSEVQSSPQRIRLGYLLSQFLWLFYGLEEQMTSYIPAACFLILAAAGSLAMYEWKRRRER